MLLVGVLEETEAFKAFLSGLHLGTVRWAFHLQVAEQGKTQSSVEKHAPPTVRPQPGCSKEPEGTCGIENWACLSATAIYDISITHNKS